MAKDYDLGEVVSGKAPVHLSAVSPPEGNGASLYSSLNAGAWTAVEPKVGPATLYGLWVTNSQAAIVYVQIFNKLTGSVTPGTTVPDIEVSVPASVGKEIPIPAVGLNLNVGFTVFCSTTQGGATGSAASVRVTAAYK